MKFGNIAVVAVAVVVRVITEVAHDPGNQYPLICGNMNPLGIISLRTKCCFPQVYFLRPPLSHFPQFFLKFFLQWQRWWLFLLHGWWTERPLVVTIECLLSTITLLFAPPVTKLKDETANENFSFFFLCFEIFFFSKSWDKLEIPFAIAFRQIWAQSLLVQGSF